MDGGGCPDDWKDSVTVPLFKGKRDPLNCGKYCGLRLLEHGMNTGNVKQIESCS